MHSVHSSAELDMICTAFISVYEKENTISSGFIRWVDMMQKHWSNVYRYFVEWQIEMSFISKAYHFNVIVIRHEYIVVWYILLNHCIALHCAARAVCNVKYCNDENNFVGFINFVGNVHHNNPINFVLYCIKYSFRFGIILIPTFL